MRTVLCCSGHDPTGGAGIQADIEAVGAQGVHALSVVTVLTVQDTTNVAQMSPVDEALLERQLELLLADCMPSAIKFGLLGGAAQLPVLAATLRRLAVPVVMDPILRAGGGRELVDAAFAEQVRLTLFPLCTLLTPNAAEARRWTACEDLDQAGEALLATGAAHVLITGGDEQGDEVVNRWYSKGMPKRSFIRPRVPGHFHGAGCTLAAAIAARLALGEDMAQALAISQAYVHTSLENAHRVGLGRWLPGRNLMRSKQ